MVLQQIMYTTLLLKIALLQLAINLLNMMQLATLFITLATLWVGHVVVCLVRLVAIFIPTTVQAFAQAKMLVVL